MATMRRVSGRVLALVWLTSAPAHAQTPAPAATGIVRGVVVDRADGTAIGDVSVRVQDAGAPVKTDAEGRFELAGVPAGQQTLYVSVVGFILVKRPIDVRPGEPLELTIALSEEVKIGSSFTLRGGAGIIIRCPASRKPSACGRGRTSCPSAPSTPISVSSRRWAPMRGGR